MLHNFAVLHFILLWFVFKHFFPRFESLKLEFTYLLIVNFESQKHSPPNYVITYQFWAKSERSSDIPKVSVWCYLRWNLLWRVVHGAKFVNTASANEITIYIKFVPCPILKRIENGIRSERISGKIMFFELIW